MPGCELSPAARRPLPRQSAIAFVRHCVLSAPRSQQANLPELAAASAQCTVQARQLSPIQASACQPMGAWHCAAGFADHAPCLRGGDACVTHFRGYLEQQGFLVDTQSGGTEAQVECDNSGNDRGDSTRLTIDTCLGSANENNGALQVKAPSFVGNQSQGWDAAFAAMVLKVHSGELPIAYGLSVNLVLGFEHLAANYRVMQQLLSPFGMRINLLSDPRAQLEPQHYSNQPATTTAQLQAAAGADDTLLVRPWQLPRSAELMRERWGQPVTALPIPMGLAWTDAWLNHLAKLSEEEVPALIQLERFRLCESIHEALPLICRQRFAVVGEPDFVMGISRYLIELGAGPALILCQNGDRRWRDAMLGLLSDSGYQGDVVVEVGSLSSRLAQLLEQTPADLLLAPPAFSHHERTPPGLPKSLKRVALEDPIAPGDPPATLGYAGARHILNAILRAVRSPC